LVLTPENLPKVKVVEVLKVGLCRLKVASDELTEACQFPESSSPYNAGMASTRAVMSDTVGVSA
jgi:isoaspartyl peptidase/L-asparaginase-like protein (Ntn-hydrolase superfamily)